MSKLHSFLWLSNIPLYMHITFCLSSHLFMDPRDASTLAIMNNAAMNISVQVSESCFQILLDIHLGVKLLGHWVVLWLASRNCQSVFQRSCSISHCHPHCTKVPNSLHLNIVIFCVFNKNHSLSSGCEVVLICMFLMTNDVTSLTREIFSNVF